MRHVVSILKSAAVVAVGISLYNTAKKFLPSIP